MIFFDIIFSPYKNDSLFDSPVIAALIGFLLAFSTNLIRDLLKERNELINYEYILLKETKDILESRESDKKRIVDRFLENYKFYADIRFTKLHSMILIRDSLDKALKNEDVSSELSKIDSRLGELSKKGIGSKIIMHLETMYKFFRD